MNTPGPRSIARTGTRCAESRWVAAERATLYCEAYGAGPAVLLVHGAFDNLIHWSLTIPALVRAGYRVLAFNLRGHFQSPCEDPDAHFRFHAADIAAVADAFGVQRAAVVAHSFGGFGALRYCLQWPERAAALVMMGSTAGVYSDANFAANSGVLAHFDRIYATGDVRFPADFAPHSNPCRFLYRQIAQLGSLDGSFACPWSALKSMDDASAWLRPAQLESYSTPTLVVGGDRDSVLPAGFQREVVRLIPGARESEWTDADHSPHWEDPERFNHCVLRFMEECGWAGQARA